MKQAQISADPQVPVIRITRDFHATPAQLLRAHTDPDLYVRWVGPNDTDTRIDYWDDSGFTADGTFVSDDELHHGGMVFRRES